MENNVTEKSINLLSLRSAVVRGFNRPNEATVFHGRSGVGGDSSREVWVAREARTYTSRLKFVYRCANGRYTRHVGTSRARVIAHRCNNYQRIDRDA